MHAHFQQYLPFYRRNLKLAGPIVLSQLGGTVVQLIDTLMVGRLGTKELAAVSFASSVFIIAFVFANGILFGATPLVGVSYVRGERNRLVSLFQNNILLALTGAVVISGVLLCVAKLLPHMGQPDEVVRLATPYFMLLIAGVLPLMLFTAVKQFLEGLGNTAAAMIINIGANLLNVLLNYVLIFGYWGFPALGIIGAGIATLISRLAMPMAYFVLLRVRAEWWSYCSKFARNRFSWTYLKELLRMGMPIGLQSFFEVTSFAFSSVMIGWIGAVPLAGNQIVNNLSNLSFMVVLGIAAATTIRVSHQMGMHDYQAVRMAANASIHLCLLTNAITALLFITLRVPIVTIFTTDPAVIKIGSQLLVLAGIFQLSDGMQAIGAGILRGLADVRITMIYAFIVYICICLPMGYVMAFPLGMGAAGIWTAYIASLSIAAVLFRLRYMKRFRELDQLSATKHG